MSRLMYASRSWSGYLNVECVRTIQKLSTKSVKWGDTCKSYQVADILRFMMKNCFLLCVSGLTIAYIICCRVNVTLDMILGVEHILISCFVIILALQGAASLFVCCMIHCKHLH